MDEVFDLILAAKEKNLITESNMDVLLSIVMQKQINNTITNFIEETIEPKSHTEKHTMFMHLNSHRKKHA